MVQILSREDNEITATRLEIVEKLSEADSSDSNDTEVEIEKTNGEQSSESFKLEITEDINLEEIIVYMADVKAPTNQLVFLDLQLLVNICNTCDHLSGKVKGLIDENTNLICQLNNFNQLKEENALLRHRITDLQSKLKSDENDLTMLNSKVNEQIQIVELARDAVATKTRDFS